jgi:hypothetical protein
VVCQVYPRNFADSDGDGTGDLAGLRDRLPYLAGLAVPFTCAPAYAEHDDYSHP